MSFDDSALATRVWPEPTTIRQPIAEISRQAVILHGRRRVAAERAAQPLAGGLFAFGVDTPGLPQHDVAHA